MVMWEGNVRGRCWFSEFYLIWSLMNIEFQIGMKYFTILVMSMKPKLKIRVPELHNVVVYLPYSVSQPPSLLISII